ncbi:MAG TPA: TIGR02444 family protein [Caulobacteraceae bacterium]|jgi:uncharacterized protein (TIGR02444 family)|nr:TIGR02444 family protein [Caulobacteraceae bacterium]
MRVWDWASAAYAREGVEAACLDLQDGYDQSIPYLLWAAWAAATGRLLDAEALEFGSETARVWDNAAVEPLRVIRRRLKKPIPDMGDTAREILRVQVKAAELTAERLLLEDLETLAPPQNGQPLPLAQALVAAAKAWSSVTPRAQLETLASALSD